jgi:nucleotide-binding universal stress UspA family protein
MQKIRHIVVPVDLDRHTGKLVDFAVDMAARLDCDEVTFFHGVDFEYGPMGEMVLGNFSYEDYNSLRVDQAKKKLDEIVQKATCKCKKCGSKVAFGYVVDEIVQYAKDQEADMIIIGTHGKRAIEKILLGSVAERVIKKAHCPILVMNPYR